MRKPSVHSGFLLVEAVGALGGLFIVLLALLHLGRSAQRLHAPMKVPPVYKTVPAQQVQYVVNGFPRTLTVPSYRAVCVEYVWSVCDSTASVYDS